MLRRVINKTISGIKGDNYSIDTRLSTPVLLAIIFERLKMATRGLLKKYHFKRCSGRLYLGKKTSIKNPRLISLGKDCTIEDNCYIQALSLKGITIGNNFKLGRNSTIECTGVIRELGDSLFIGNNVGISANAFISVRGKIAIGNDTIIGPNVSIQAENHNYSDNKIPIRLQGTNRKGIKIGNNCWIGSNVIILDGVHIGDGAVIGAGSIVTKDIERNTVAVGIPAKKIKERV